MTRTLIPLLVFALISALAVAAPASKASAAPAAPAPAVPAAESKEETVEQALCRLIEGAAKSKGLPVAFLTRLGAGIVPNRQTAIQHGDVLHVVIKHEDRDAVEAAIAAGPEDHR